MIEEDNVLVDYPSGMALVEDQDMIQAFAPNAAEKAVLAEKVIRSASNGPRTRTGS